MKKILMNSIILLLLTIILSGCNSAAGLTGNSETEDVNFSPSKYAGENLKIGMVGEAPDVAEDNVEFVSLTLDDIETNNFKNVDAVFIGKEHLSEAAEAKYAKIYLESSVPFVFINSEKVYLAFTDEELSYEDAHTSKSGDYLIGYYNEKYFGLGLYDGQETKKTIQDCYSRIFTIIEDAKNTGEINI